MRALGFFADKLLLTFVVFMIIACATVPLISAVVVITATVGQAAPTVGKIRICDGTCAVNKSFTDTQYFTLEVTVSDPNGVADINYKSFRVTIFHNTDANSDSDDWDHNSLFWRNVDDNLSLGNANGCTQSAGVFCINVPDLAWSNKFLFGDVNIYVAVDDNGGNYDMNAVDANALDLAKILSRSEDTSTGTYSGNPSSTDNAFVNSTTDPNTYIVTTHTGNVSLDVTVAGSDFNGKAYESFDMAYIIGDGNQSWHLSDDAGNSTPFTGAADTVDTAFHRGASPDSNTFDLYLWLDIPATQPSGAYDGNLVYDQSEAS